ncbi:helicase-related protein [Roseomonas sp. CCTCC AB2023176]|uniref:helicase-related protein n=1 Tax=Roseomonas sp. CCTCC AB2023176 TaxID=3342640 RepID=UPI0035DE462F
MAEAIRTLEGGLRRERDRTPFSAASRQARRDMARMLRSGKLETRLYQKAFLHAKATLLDGFQPALIAGSSNLTRAGLERNRELNLGLQDPGVFAQARAWYDALWEDAVPYDLAALFEEGEAEYPPHLIFLRMLWQLYGAELDQERQEVGDIPLTAFQKHGVHRAQTILRQYGGVIVADEVGLGKTFIAGEILNACARNRQRALLVCPAALRDTTWKRFLHEYGTSRFIECVSFDELSRDRQFHDPRRPLATQAVLGEPIEDYALVVVDEAHNYRNPGAPYRAEVLTRLLAGPRKDVVLLTATPVNNSLWDLYHLVHFFLKQHGALAPLGIVDFHERFKDAARQDPYDLSPDFLYPVIDAVTVKRTRAFVRKHYSNEEIVIGGVKRPIQFPKAVPISVRYDLDRAAPGLFDAVADALDPEHGRHVLSFARYTPDAYLLDATEEEREAAGAASGLLRSGLLKRFESSAHAFRLSLDRMVGEHDAFLDALAKGKVVTSAFLRELSGDEDAFDDLLESGDLADAADYDARALRDAVERDRAILAGLAGRVGALRDRDDPKLREVVNELKTIVAEARGDAATDEDERRNRKVLVFSYFADTVDWLRGALRTEVGRDKALSAYAGRIAAVAGGGLDDEVSRNVAVWGFAPETSDPPTPHEDLFDILVTTDVLAEGMNLQQCRHIINYDLPWNPMRLVQRHGRIDRIGSRHPRVFLRTVFPSRRLDDLLALEKRVMAKLTSAIRTIGQATPPLDGATAGEQVFAEIRRLEAEDGTLFDRGGTEAAAQTGEEYRQRLRTALLSDRDAITSLPGQVGSGFRRGTRRGVVVCAEVETVDSRRSFLRFVPADAAWYPETRVVREVGTCLRLADCEEGTPRHLPAGLTDGIFAFWAAAQADIVTEWDALTDPANLQPAVRPLNRQVAAFLRAHPVPGMETGMLTRALDILESPWPRREEMLLRERFRDRDRPNEVRARSLIDWIIGTGLEASVPPAPLPPITTEHVRLVCWMGLDVA